MQAVLHQSNSGQPQADCHDRDRYCDDEENAEARCDCHCHPPTSAISLGLIRVRVHDALAQRERTDQKSSLRRGAMHRVASARWLRCVRNRSSSRTLRCACSDRERAVVRRSGAAAPAISGCRGTSQLAANSLFRAAHSLGFLRLHFGRSRDRRGRCRRRSGGNLSRRCRRANRIVLRSRFGTTWYATRTRRAAR